MALLGATSPGPPRSYSADWVTFTTPSGAPRLRTTRLPLPASLLGRPSGVGDAAILGSGPPQGHLLDAAGQQQAQQQRPGAPQQGRGARIMGYQVTTEGSGLVRTSSTGSAGSAAGESLGLTLGPLATSALGTWLSGRVQERAPSMGWPRASSARGTGLAARPLQWPMPQPAPLQSQLPEQPHGDELGGAPAAKVHGPFAPLARGESVVAWYRLVVSRLGGLLRSPSGGGGNCGTEVAGELDAAVDSLMDSVHALSARDR